jgi:hypothetical protein
MFSLVFQLKEIIYEGDFTTKFMETFSIKGGD